MTILYLTTAFVKLLCVTTFKHGFQFNFLCVSLDILVAMFYWMLLNIHPAHRSTLKSIQLLTVVKATHLKKYGIDAILEPSIRDLKTLGTTVSFKLYNNF